MRIGDIRFARQEAEIFRVELVYIFKNSASADVVFRARIFGRLVFDFRFIELGNRFLAGAQVLPELPGAVRTGKFSRHSYYGDCSGMFFALNHGLVFSVAGCAVKRQSDLLFDLPRRLQAPGECKCESHYSEANRNVSNRHLCVCTYHWPLPWVPFAALPPQISCTEHSSIRRSLICVTVVALNRSMSANMPG